MYTNWQRTRLLQYDLQNMRPKQQRATLCLQSAQHGTVHREIPRLLRSNELRQHTL